MRGEIKVKNYINITTASDRNVDEYLKKGWEIINTTKSSYDPSGNDTILKYHSGYPVQKKYEELLSIVRLYEEHGFKENLFTKLAIDEGVNLDDYSVNGEIGMSINNPVIDVIKKYEHVVNDNQVTFYRKLSKTTSENEID